MKRIITVCTIMCGILCFCGNKTTNSTEAIISDFQIDTTMVPLRILQLESVSVGFTNQKPDIKDTTIILSIAASFTYKDLVSNMGEHIV